MRNTWTTVIVVLVAARAVEKANVLFLFSDDHGYPDLDGTAVARVV